MKEEENLPSIRESIISMGNPDFVSSRFRKTKKWTPKSQCDVLVLRTKGYSIEQIAESFGSSYYSIVSILSKVTNAVKICKELEKRDLL